MSGSVPIELECGQRIDRRDLVVDEHATSGGGHAHQLGHCELRPGNVMQRAARARKVERTGLERQARSIALDERHIRRRIRARALEQLGNEVDPDDVAHERRERERKRSRTGAHVHRPLVAAWHDERLELLAHHVHLLPCVLRDAVRGRGEPLPHLLDVSAVRHRSRCAARAADCSRSRTRGRS
jgi:hypothetical protein